MKWWERVIAVLPDVVRIIKRIRGKA